MQITHLGHSCVLVETAGARILLDPGNYSDRWHGLTDIDAIAITHQHPDHVDPVNLPELIAANPGVVVWQEPDVPKTLAIEGARPLRADTSVSYGGVTIAAVGGLHAIIHPDIPRIGNVGLVLSAAGEPTLFHPGDALDTVPAGVDILALPMHGPWAAMREHVDFLRAVRPAHAFGIHEALLSPAGWKLAFNRYREMGPGEMHDLRSGEPVVF